MQELLRTERYRGGRGARRPATSISGSSADSQSGYLDVLTHGEVSEGVAVLERARETRAPAAVRPPARDVAILELDGARARKVEARHDVHERRLAGAVRPDEPTTSPRRSSSVTPWSA